MVLGGRNYAGLLVRIFKMSILIKKMDPLGVLTFKAPQLTVFHFNQKNRTIINN